MDANKRLGVLVFILLINIAGVGMIGFQTDNALSAIGKKNFSIVISMKTEAP